MITQRDLNARREQAEMCDDHAQYHAEMAEIRRIQTMLDSLQPKKIIVYPVVKQPTKALHATSVEDAFNKMKVFFGE